MYNIQKQERLQTARHSIGMNICSRKPNAKMKRKILTPMSTQGAPHNPVDPNWEVRWFESCRRPELR